MSKQRRQKKSSEKTKSQSSTSRELGRFVYFGRRAARKYRSLDPFLRTGVRQTVHRLRTTGDLADLPSFRQLSDRVASTQTTSGTVIAFSEETDRDAVIIADLDQTGIVRISRPYEPQPVDIEVSDSDETDRSS